MLLKSILKSPSKIWELLVVKKFCRSYAVCTEVKGPKFLARKGFFFYAVFVGYALSLSVNKDQK